MFTYFFDLLNKPCCILQLPPKFRGFGQVIATKLILAYCSQVEVAIECANGHDFEAFWAFELLFLIDDFGKQISEQCLSPFVFKAEMRDNGIQEEKDVDEVSAFYFQLVRFIEFVLHGIQSFWVGAAQEGVDIGDGENDDDLDLLSECE